jgi:membrane-bound lytic murein transglycosylase D
MKRFLFFIGLFFCLAGIQAQVQSITIHNDKGQEEAIEVPESMESDMDSLYWDWLSKNHLSLDTECQMTATSPVVNDSVYIDRLSRIPSVIEMPYNEPVKKLIEAYTTRLRSKVSFMLAAANFYMPIFEEALEKYGLPLELRYLPVIESALVPTATSRVGAGGLWQFMLTTARQYGLEVNTLVDERRDPLKSSDAAARLLRDLYNMFGDWGLALASYNCGPGNVTKAIARAGNPEVKDFWTIYNYLPRETRGYVPAFIAATYIMTYYCDHGITPMEATLPQESDTIVVSKEVKFGQIANKCSNLSVDVLRTLNPQYRRDIIPANYAVRLPSANIEEFILLEDSIYGSTPQAIVTNIPNVQASKSTSAKKTTSTKKSRSKTVTVKSGDSLGRIASRNGTTVAKLRRLNGIKGDMIRPGQKIRVR